ncbi:hypothetical protein D3C80_1317360 [compost metagenome]
MQVNRLLQVRPEQLDQRPFRGVEVRRRMAAAGEQRTVHAGLGAQVGRQHVTQVQRLQVAAVEVVGQPGLVAQHLVGAGHLSRRPVEEGTDRIVVLAVGRLARQVRAVDRGVDDQAGAVVGGVAQHQGHEAGAKAQAQRLQQAGPGCRFERAAVGQGEQVAQFAGVKPRQFMGM